MSSTLQLAHNNSDSYQNLLELVNIDYWSKFLSYQILTQNFHNDYSHNFRMISDPWSGKFTPIVYDPLSRINPKKDDIDFDKSSNEIFVLLNQNSYFQDLKFENLNLILNSNIIKNEISNIEKLDDKIKISETRDVELLSNNIGIISLFIKILKNQNRFNIVYDQKKKFINKFLIHVKNINNFLQAKPKASWYKTDNGFEIYVKGKLPISNLNLFFEKNTPEWLTLDLNENNKVDKDELQFKINLDKKITIPLKFYANRIPYTKKTSELAFPELKTLPTRFKFITEESIKPSQINFENPFSKKIYNLEYKKYSSFPIFKNNLPIFNEVTSNNKIILEGQININKNMIYRDVVQINPGTLFLIDNGASIIFKNKVIASGTKKDPIYFKSISSKEWGTVALQGNNTKNSILDNIVFEGGSGTIFKNIKYSGALSIHDTKNIIIKNINMKNNLNYDDMIHIVYVDTIKLKNIQIENSFMDGIDIDMSNNVEINNIKINKSGNDGIDLMESNIIINNVKILNSADKGISIGENSLLF